MKWFKRIFVLLLVLGLGTVAFLGTSYYLMHRRPAWYRPVAMNSRQMDEAAARAFNKVTAIHNMADQAAAQDSAKAHGTAKSTSQPAVNPVTVTFTQDELTAFIVRWSNLHGEAVEKYVTGPQFVLHENQIVFGGELAEIEQFGSLTIEPSLDEKHKLRMDVTSVSIGSLPMAKSLVMGRLGKVEEMLRGWLPDWQRKMKIEPGGANAEAVKAAMTELLLNALHGRPSQPYFFMPIGEHKNVPVKVTDVTVKEGEITLTVEPLTADDRQAAIESFREPYGAAAANAGGGQ